MRIDLHTHSDVSDGTDAPAELVAKAAVAGLDVVALSDHDTFAGLEAAAAAAAGTGVRLVRGIEISAELDHTSVHLLGYGCRGDAAELLAELARVREGRAGRVPAMLANLARVGLPVPEPVLARHVGGSPSVGRPHLADAMIELGYVRDRREAFDTWLADDKPIFVPRYATDLSLAMRLVRAAGGATVIAHPWGRGSRERLTPAVIAGLAAAGLDGIEVDHQDHDAAARAELRELAAAAGLLATGSSDYHGIGKDEHDLGCNTTAAAVFAELEARVTARGGTMDGSV